MDKLIGVINELHDVFSEVKMDVRINLPQIAVVGSQSCGKSSVLESIVGKDLLPRGSGIVTRCPLVLQLVQLPKNNEEEWGEFLHVPGKKYFDFQEIQNEITRRTNEVAGPASITSKAINLKIFSNKVLNLTLVDLPGLVMNAVGDQPKDIDRQIKNMVVDYVSPKNTIILAISPANTDLATSQSLRLASQLDPSGERTVGVLTKVDLMDRGTDCFDILSNKVLPLRHGFVGVVCRCQQDINDSKSMEAAREAEHEFFASSTAYSSIADQSGTVFLTRKLNGLLLAHIKEVIPELRSKVESIKEKTSKQMEKLGMGEAEVEPGAKLLSLIKVFSDSVNQTIDGGITDATRELLGGARLEYIFNELFAPHIMSLSAKNDLTDEYIRVNSRNMSGMHATVFPSDQVFVALSKQQILRLEQPSGKCVTFIYDELLKIIDTCSMKLARFPQLKSAAVSICQHMLNEMNQPTANHVRLIISAERGFINVKHPSMKLYLNVLGGPESKKGTENHTNPENSAVGNGAAIPADAKEPANNKQGGSDVLLKSMEDVPNRILLGSHVTPHEQTMNNAIREMVESYFEIVKGNVADQVPKAITLLMIRRLGEDMYSRLVKELYSDTKAKDLLSEHPDIEDQRKAVTSMMTALQKAHTALNNVRDFRLPN